MTYFSTFSLNFNNQKKLDKHDGFKDYHKQDSSSNLCKLATH